MIINETLKHKLVLLQRLLLLLLRQRFPLVAHSPVPPHKDNLLVLAVRFLNQALALQLSLLSFPS